MFKVQYITHRSDNWTTATRQYSEQHAIQDARQVAGRRNVERVRVIDEDGHVVWMS